MGPHPAVAAIRLAVRRVLHDLLTEHHTNTPQHAPACATPGAPSGTGAQPLQAPPTAVPPAAVPIGVRRNASARAGSPHPGTAHERPLVLVACSGGADSMALASALAFEAPKLGVRAGGITVDHGLQPGSDLRAEEVALRLRELGLDPVESVAVTVGRDGGP
ncbi:ATP-binding protein, partial [Streptomyces europaeiscabiei]